MLVRLDNLDQVGKESWSEGLPWIAGTSGHGVNKFPEKLISMLLKIQVSVKNYDILAHSKC